MSKFFVIFAFALAARSASAWNAEGHMVVAQIAYNHLEPGTKSKCDLLIATPLAYGSSANNTFVTAACWADDYKSSLGTAIWHYIDLPFSLDGTPTNGVTPASFDVVQAIQLCLATLQNPSASQSNQAVSLRYLLHLVGDIQQPLHCSTAVSASQTSGDAGGNGFALSGSYNNLHSLWDAGGGLLADSVSRPLTAGGQSILNTRVTNVESNYPYAPNFTAQATPMQWAMDGLELAQTVAYAGISRNTTPSASYLNSAKSTATERLAHGGHLLADLLNGMFSLQPTLLSMPVVTNGNLSFSWAAIAGRSYRVVWKSEITATNWQDFSNVVAATNSVFFTQPLTANQRFFRVQAL